MKKKEKKNKKRASTGGALVHLELESHHLHVLSWKLLLARGEETFHFRAKKKKTCSKEVCHQCMRTSSCTAIYSFPLGIDDSRSKRQKYPLSFLTSFFSFTSRHVEMKRRRRRRRRRRKKTVTTTSFTRLVLRSCVQGWAYEWIPFLYSVTIQISACE